MFKHEYNEKLAIEINIQGRSILALLMIPTSQVQSLAFLSGLRIGHCHELWCWPAATTPIRPLAWKLTYATGAALKTKKKKKKKKRERERENVGQRVQTQIRYHHMHGP